MKVPQGWKYIKFGKIFTFKNGVNADKTFYGNGIKFINVMDVFKSNVIVTEDMDGKVSLPEKAINDHLVINGDILFNRTSEVAEEIAMSSVYLGNERVVFGGFVIRARPKGNILDDMFKKYCFCSVIVRKEIIRRGQGAIRSNIGQSDLCKIAMLIPPLFEQKKIAEILLGTYRGRCVLT